MGLLIIVGDLAEFLEGDENYNLDEPNEEDIEEYKEIYRALDRFLIRCGLPGHQEPEILEKIPYRGESDNFTYPCLHYLRRAYVYKRKGLTVRPFEGELASKDSLLAAEYNLQSLDSHLVYHSDCEGFYVPIDFTSPLIALEEDDVLGDIVGSSYGLLRELIELAPAIDILLNNGDLSEDKIANLIFDRHRDGHQFETERSVWFSLFEAARNSINYKTAIRFG
ncbi:hypothetical protein [Chamaesiphon minutus]|uniref:Uncharacterized protein n=1 Tax=Chamaesiphon minutus (strain ATCC 27169 / PCC 6605) TaxID=1173020 RepID=K9UGQ1_CHAP6|nr:hypothetical protein [Chamaesiphon minutus]AFY94272.1 hypothetical protein Cha6605_3263 [Chamaesiphon minutus PCC 6605]